MDYQIFEAGDVVLQGGATIRNCQLAFKTFGTLNAAKNNVNAEFGVANVFDWLNDASRAGETLWDVIILDPPPALGAISLSVMRAANALLVPAWATWENFRDLEQRHDQKDVACPVPRVLMIHDRLTDSRNTLDRPVRVRS